MKIKFIKMHGLGNDFVIFDGRNHKITLIEKQLAALADRKTGIGCDQVIVMESRRHPQSDIFMAIYNADGGEAGACGNATRCVASLLFSETGKEKSVIETRAGILTAAKAGKQVSVDMGKALLEWDQIPLKEKTDTLCLPIAVGDLKNPIAVNVGNPHAVFFVDDINEVPLEICGRAIENHAFFPERTNVEIAKVIDPATIRMRVWERGAGLTRACGTGACAVAVAGVRRNLTERKVKVLQEGGELLIEWRENDGHVLMTGPAVEVYRGEIDLSQL